MPFKSKAQQRACYAKQDAGTAGSWNCEEWSEKARGKKMPATLKQALEKQAWVGAVAKAVLPTSTVPRFKNAAIRQVMAKVGEYKPPKPGIEVKQSPASSTVNLPNISSLLKPTSRPIKSMTALRGTFPQLSTLSRPPTQQLPFSPEIMRNLEVAGKPFKVSPVNLMPRGYADKAVPAAKAYRDKNPDGPKLFQSLSEKSLTRPVSVLPQTIAPSGAAGSYHPLFDRIKTNRENLAELDPVRLKARHSTLGHETVHSMQRDGLRGAIALPSAEMLSDRYSQEAKSILERTDNYIPPSVVKYLSDNAEIEAFLADLKRKHFEDTGSVGENAEEVRNALDSFRGKYESLVSPSITSDANWPDFRDKVLIPRWFGIVQGPQSYEDTIGYKHGVDKQAWVGVVARALLPAIRRSMMPTNQ